MVMTHCCLIYFDVIYNSLELSSQNNNNSLLFFNCITMSQYFIQFIDEVCKVF